MNRAEAYAFIKSHEDLKATINSKGKNFTNFSTAMLAGYIDSYKLSKSQHKHATPVITEETKKTKDTSNNSLSRLIEVLGKKRILIAKEIEYILG